MLVICNFQDMIIGHKEQQEKIRSLFEKNEIPHALLFSGPGAVGKKTTAFWFLKMISCEGRDKPCGECRSCYEIEENIHLDILQVFPEEKEIRLKQIEEIIERISYKGAKSCYKGVVIDEAHLMNVQSQNALLKTLEEPSKDTVIILVTEHPYSLLPTILSRMFEIKFSLVSEKEIGKSLKSNEIADLSFGKPGLAINYLQFPEKKKRAENLKKEMNGMFEKDFSFRFSLIKKATDEEKGEEFLECLLKAMQIEMHKRIKEKKETKDFLQAIKEAEEAIFLLSKTNINVRLALEKIAIKI